MDGRMTFSPIPEKASDTCKRTDIILGVDAGACVVRM